MGHKRKKVALSRITRIKIDTSRWRSSQVSVSKHKTSQTSAIHRMVVSDRPMTDRKNTAIGRLVEKSGKCNIKYLNVKQQWRKLNDLFTSVLELSWRLSILLYVGSFILSWIIFALIWLAIYAASSTPCIDGVTGFTTALLFSIETQHTIGYGTRAITDQCPFAIIILIIQSILGAVLQCILTGIMFAKMARPNRRAATIIFSEKAVIYKESQQEENAPQIWKLEFRVGDIRDSNLIGVSISALLVKKDFGRNNELGVYEGARQLQRRFSFSPEKRRGTALTYTRTEGALEQSSLKLSTEREDDFYFLGWPIKVIHKIDESSPFYGCLAGLDSGFSKYNFEIIVILQASCEATGGTVQVKTSYLPNEIECKGRLADLLTKTKVNEENEPYKIDYSLFDEITYQDPTQNVGNKICCWIETPKERRSLHKKIKETTKLLSNEAETPKGQIGSNYQYSNI